MPLYKLPFDCGEKAVVSIFENLNLRAKAFINLLVKFVPLSVRTTLGELKVQMNFFMNASATVSAI